MLILTEMTRILRLCYRIEYLSLFLSTFLRMILTFVPLLMVMLAAYYFFSFVGIEAYGGMIYLNNVKLDNIFGQSNYYALNFNDFPNAIVVVFNTQILNNWNVMFSGIEAVTNGGSRAYFIIMWVVLVLILTNIVISRNIETFIPKWQEAKATLNSRGIQLEDESKIQV